MINKNEKTAILGSHNSWSYLPPRKWWMKPFAFMARCQKANIRAQYERYGVRCFDLRIRFDALNRSVIAHGVIEYGFTAGSGLYAELHRFNEAGDVMVRVLHEVRSKGPYTEEHVRLFRAFCESVAQRYPNIRFWCGRNLYNWEKDYDFGEDPSCEERYASVSRPRMLDDWWPWLFARLRNRAVLQAGTDKDVLLMDFVNIR